MFYLRFFQSLIQAPKSICMAQITLGRKGERSNGKPRGSFDNVVRDIRFDNKRGGPQAGQINLARQIAALCRSRSSKCDSNFSRCFPDYAPQNPAPKYPYFLVKVQSCREKVGPENILSAGTADHGTEV